MEPGRANPQSTAPPLAPAWNSSFYTAEGALEGGFRQIFTCSSRSSVLNLRKFSDECFLQVSMSFWTTFVPMNSCFWTESSDIFERWRGGGISLLLKNVHLACEDWGVRRCCFVWVPAHGQRWVVDGWTTWSTRSLPTLMILWSSDAYPVTILKRLLSFNFIAPELRGHWNL